jgi:hypothetical protein
VFVLAHLHLDKLLLEVFPLEEDNLRILCIQLSVLVAHNLHNQYNRLNVLVVRILAILLVLHFALVHRHLGKLLLEVFLLEGDNLGTLCIQ